MAPQEVGAGDRERVERRVELGGRELHLGERLAGQGERGRQADVVARGDLGDPLQDRPELDLLERGVAEACDEQAELLVEPRRGRWSACFSSPLSISMTSVRNGTSSLPERQQQEQEQLARLRADLADHPEVEEVDLVVPPLQVARVGIGVEEARRSGSGGSTTRAAAGPPPCGLGPSGASRSGTPWTSSMTSSRAVDSSVYTPGTSSRE